MTELADLHTTDETGASVPPLLRMARETPTRLWNDSATPAELSAAIGWGAVGATCNPVIALAALRSDLPRWRQRIRAYAEEHHTASESDIGWAMVQELSVEAAALLADSFLSSYCARLAQHPHLGASLGNGLAPLGEHEEFFRFASALNRDVTAGVIGAAGRALRGGSYASLTHGHLRCARRSASRPGRRSAHIGFRVARPVGKEGA